MGKSKVTALVIAVSIIGIAFMRTATASHETQAKAFSGGATFKGQVIKTNEIGAFVTADTTTWQTVDSRGFQIPAGESQLISVDFFATTVCVVNPDSGDCLIRALVGRTLGTAVELDPGAPSAVTPLDTAGDDGIEAHAVSKALCVRNATASPADISVWIQGANSGGSGVTYELDTWTLKIARHAPCTPFEDI